ncbi:MAG: outer membrane lipoprotein carrier protein LolA [Desulfobacteraceae bacterium]|nr:outer membrane lipoprotein carrier protein LolA [Desulfobacterales bacterium]MBL6967958.1 outer membrane lipoprotein carrier protein LolA [Desulfobacteraceae bacterium]MBL7102181.1 outer membrane lipoprotein carrier protein LolA [Desulfobacteraceae bacterium]MBL7172043.1 outer membrane lipoprotein carrier protein LolA [Desulfobacteraceae bacterium]MBU0735861.1 outer membrane lipoprotein carrier protein LolA [Pseudomonadota bacterium]
MLRRLIVFPLLIFLLQGPAMADESLVDILQGIKRNYGNLAGLSLPYSREVVTRSMSMLGDQAKGDMASGNIFFKHPYFLRLEQEKPKAETIIANNDILWWYIPDKKCAYQYPSKDFGKELRLLSDIFRGLSRVENSFQVVLQGRNTSGEHEMDLIPDPPWEEIDRIALTITGQYEIRSVQIYNRLGSITIFNLGGLTEKKDFEEGFFRFVAPKGVRLMIEGAVQ